VLLTSGCFTTDEGPFDPPAVDLGVEVYAGSPLSGPRGPAAAVSEAYGHARAEISILERLPDDFLSPLASEARLVVATGPGSPFPPSTRRTRAARVGKTAAEAAEFRQRLEDGEFGRWNPIGDLVGEMGPDATTVFLLSSRATSELPQVRGAVREKLEIRVRLMPAGVLSAAMVVENIEDRPPEIPLLEGLDPGEPPDHPRDLYGETVLLAVPPDSDRFVLTLLGRSPFEEHEGAGLAVIIEVTVGPDFLASAGGPPGPGETAIAPLRHLRALEAQEPVGDRPGPGFETAIPGLEPSEQQRRTLAFLARETGARLAADAALSAPDARISELAARLAAGAATLPRPLTPAALGWLLERETLLLCIEVADALADEQVLGLLLSRTGDAGRYTADLKTLVLASGDLPSFEAALVRENLLHLEDNAPAARVRAYDWLLLRDRAPPGFDPLGTRDERRKALEEALAGLNGDSDP
jgi:hypothetical protein